jgi:hypothetical protein
MLKTYFAKMIQGVLFLVSTLLTFFDFFQNVDKKTQIIVLIVCVLGYALFCALDILREKKRGNIEKFKEYDNEFFDYFQRWYERPGKLCVFCTDLDWMRRGAHDLILTLCNRRKQGHDCTVYLLNDIARHTDRQQLEEAEVKIVIVKPHISTSHRFSLREDEGTTFLIIRNKRLESDLIEFRKEDSSSNPYLINLAKDLLELLDKQNG